MAMHFSYNSSSDPEKELNLIKVLDIFFNSKLADVSAV
jgi:hypothetical protein